MMASASDCEQLDVHEVVGLLMQDSYVIDNKGQAWRILDIPYSQVKAAEDQYRSGAITIEDLFTKMISCWKSKTSGSQKDLSDILNENGFGTSAGWLKTIFALALCVSRSLSLINPKFIST
jgi:hypothetical protein